CEMNIADVGFVTRDFFRCRRNVCQVVQFDIVFIAVHGIQSAGGQQFLVGANVERKNEIVVGAVLIMHPVGNNFDCLPLIAGKLPLNDLSVASAGIDEVMVLSGLECTGSAFQVAFKAFCQRIILVAQGREQAVVHVI